DVVTLADLPPLRDGLLFIGLNPSPVSVEAGHYHQGRLGRTFWRRLMLAGVGPLWQKIAIWRPAAVVFIYKRAATITAGRDLRETWGALPGVALAGRPCFLMPAPYASTEEVDEGLNFLRNLASSLPRDRS